MSALEIEAFAKTLNVPWLCHFTRASHLASILQHGLYPIERAFEAGISPVINDPYRHDGHAGASSLSIGFPNYKMFYKCRQGDTAIDWVVLAIDPSVLWRKDCAFCRHNAADSKISSQAITALKSVDAFQSMYDEIDGLPSRAEEKLHPYDPTDVQAEILVFDVIEPQLITGVAFSSQTTRQANASILGERQVNVGNVFFSSRGYVRKG